MNNRECFQATSLSYELQAARRELAGFRSGEAYQKLRADYEGTNPGEGPCHQEAVEGGRRVGRKKTVNNREGIGKKPGAQAGHPHHPRRPMEPDQVMEIAAKEKLKDSSYFPTP